MNSESLLDYHRGHVCSRQWSGFLVAMAQEFENALPEGELMKLMARIGVRFARANPLPQVETLEQLQLAANEVWQQSRWGAVSFHEDADQVLIYHLVSPLRVVLGTGAHWGAGFLEGVYRQWFKAAGMLSVLDIGFVPGDHPDISTYTLSRVF